MPAPVQPDPVGRVVVASFLFAGHVFEHLALAERLLASGVPVTFYADAWAQGRTTEVGCDFIEAPTGRAADAFREVTSTEDVTRIYAELDARIAPHLLDVLRRDEVKAVITDSTSLGAALAAERSGLPWACLSTTPAEFDPVVRRTGAQYLASAAALRDVLGLPPSDAPTADQMLSPRLVMGTWSPSFDTPLVPAQTQHIGPLFLDAGDSIQDVPALASLDPSRPSVLLSSSSVAIAALEECASYIHEVAASVLEQLDVHALISASGKTPVSDAPDPGSNIVALPFVPHAVLLPRVDVMVSHGGWGTVGRALAHGIPLVLTPLALDQPQVAALCEACGVGIALDYDDLDEDSLHAALERVLAPDSSYRRRAAALRTELRQTMARADPAASMRALVARHGP